MGCSCYLGLGSAAPAPRFLGTQPPIMRRRCLIEVYYNVCDNVYVIKYQDFSPRAPKEIPGIEEQREELE